MPRKNSNDPVTIALAAVAATFSDERRAQRFLDLTGIGTEELRSRLKDPILLVALLRFLEAYEPDLVSVSAALGAKPEELVEVRRQLEQGTT